MTIIQIITFERPDGAVQTDVVIVGGGTAKEHSVTSILLAKLQASVGLHKDEAGRDVMCYDEASLPRN